MTIKYLEKFKNWLKLIKSCNAFDAKLDKMSNIMKKFIKIILYYKFIEKLRIIFWHLIILPCEGPFRDTPDPLKTNNMLNFNKWSTTSVILALKVSFNRVC